MAAAIRTARQQPQHNKLHDHYLVIEPPQTTVFTHGILRGISMTEQLKREQLFLDKKYPPIKERKNNGKTVHSE